MGDDLLGEAAHLRPHPILQQHLRHLDGALVMGDHLGQEIPVRIACEGHGGHALAHGHMGRLQGLRGFHAPRRVHSDPCAARGGGGAEACPLREMFLQRGDHPLVAALGLGPRLPQVAGQLLDPPLQPGGLRAAVGATADRQRQTQRRKNRESGHQVFPRHALIGASGQGITHQRPAQTMTLAPGSILI